MSLSDRTVRIELTPDEALVLFEWTHRHEDDGYAGLAFTDSGERVAFYALSASLESVVDGAFSEDYLDLVAAARKRLAAET